MKEITVGVFGWLFFHFKLCAFPLVEFFKLVLFCFILTNNIQGLVTSQEIMQVLS